MGMGRFLQTAVSAVLFALLMLVPDATANQERQKPGKKEKPVRKDVMNFDGGVFFETDGSLSEITCFRVSGRVTAPHFFDGLKRIDDEHGTHCQRGREVVTEFPEELTISLVMFDFPCPGQLEKPGPRRYLTKEMMRTLRFSFYWKRNLELRHIEQRALAALVDLDSSSVSTLHAFCADILRRYPRQGGVDPAFAVDDGPFFQSLFEVEWESFLAEELGPGAPRPAIWGRALLLPGALDGVVDYATPDFLGIRTPAGLFRFFGRNAFGSVVGMSAHLFEDVPVTEADLKAWLDSVYS